MRRRGRYVAKNRLPAVDHKRISGKTPASHLLVAHHSLRLRARASTLQKYLRFDLLDPGRNRRRSVHPALSMGSCIYLPLLDYSQFLGKTHEGPHRNGDGEVGFLIHRSIF